MSDRYRIKPLVWSRVSGDLRADSIFGEINVVSNKSYKDADEPVEWRWSLYDDCGYDLGWQCKNAKAAKLAAESWYRERLLEALEPVEE